MGTQGSTRADDEADFCSFQNLLPLQEFLVF
jgi:hypothetical protein